MDRMAAQGGSVWLKRQQLDLFSRSAHFIKFDNLHNFLESKLLRYRSGVAKPEA
jgi:hypothetical protein